MRRLDVSILTSRRRPGRGRCDVVPNFWKRLFRRPIVLIWHRNCLATINGVTLAFNIPIARSRSTCTNFVTVNKQCVILNSKVCKCFRRLGCLTRDFSSLYTRKSEWTECAREKQENGKSVNTLVLIDSPQ